MMDKTTEDVETAELLRRYVKLPKRFAGKDVKISFTMKRRAIVPVEADCCASLQLEAGDSIWSPVTVDPGGIGVNIFAQGEIAEALLDWPDGARVVAKARTLFAIHHPTSAVRRSSVNGLLISELIDGRPSTPRSASKE